MNGGHTCGIANTMELTHGIDNTKTRTQNGSCGKGNNEPSCLYKTFGQQANLCFLLDSQRKKPQRIYFK